MHPYIEGNKTHLLDQPLVNGLIPTLDKIFVLADKFSKFPSEKSNQWVVDEEYEDYHQDDSQGNQDSSNDYIFDALGFLKFIKLSIGAEEMIRDCCRLLVEVGV